MGHSSIAFNAAYTCCSLTQFAQLSWEPVLAWLLSSLASQPVDWHRSQRGWWWTHEPVLWRSHHLASVGYGVVVAAGKSTWHWMRWPACPWHSQQTNDVGSLDVGITKGPLPVIVSRLCLAPVAISSVWLSALSLETVCRHSLPNDFCTNTNISAHVWVRLM